MASPGLTLRLALSSARRQWTQPPEGLPWRECKQPLRASPSSGSFRDGGLELRQRNRPPTRFHQVSLGFHFKNLLFSSPSPLLASTEVPGESMPGSQGGQFLLISLWGTLPWCLHPCPQHTSEIDLTVLTTQQGNGQGER